MCRCREAKSHVDCAYCGGGGDGVTICGRCRLDGIDGPVIPGTSEATCQFHSRAAEKEASRQADASSGKNAAELNDENAHFAKLRVTLIKGRRLV